MTEEIRCPNCRALIKGVDPSARLIRCPYCEAEAPSPVYRAPRPAAPHPAGAASAPAGRSLSGVWAAVVITVALGAIGLSLLLRRGAQPESTTPQQVSSATEYRHWFSVRPHVADVDGDGVEDVVGRMLFRDHDVTSGAGTDRWLVVAVGGRKLAPLWEHELSAQNVALYRAADLLLLVDRHKLTALALRSGKRLWQTAMSDRIGELALAGDALQVKTLADETWHPLRRADGKPAAEGATEPGTPLRCDRAEAAISMMSIDMQYDHFAGYKLVAVYCSEPQRRTSTNELGRTAVSCALPSTVAQVKPQSGAPVPHLLGYDAKTKQQRWVRRLTPEGSVEPLAGEALFAALGPLAAIAYRPEPKAAHHLELFALADGTPRWNIALRPKGKNDPPTGVVLGAQRVYVTFTHELEIRDGATGKLLHRHGRAAWRTGRDDAS